MRPRSNQTRLVGLAAIVSASVLASLSGSSARGAVDCEHLPQTADARAVGGSEGTSVTLRAPSTYYEGCDEVGDPLTVTVDWGDGRSSTATVTRIPDDERRLEIRADHVYDRPVSAQIVIRQRNDRTGVEREDRHYSAVIRAVAPEVRLDLRPRGVASRHYRGRVATVSMAGRRSASDLAARLDWGDGTRTKGRIVRSGSRFVVSGRHRWKRGLTSSARITLSVYDSVGERTSRVSRLIRP